MNIQFAMLNGWEIVLILAVVLVLFGAKKLPDLARGLGQGIKEFKKATREVTDEIQTAIDMEAPPPPPRKLPSENASAQGAPVEQSSSEPSSEPKA